MAEKAEVTGGSPPEALERDIEQTRRELSGTVEAIQERLSAEHFRETAKEKIRARFRAAGDRVRHAASRFGQTAKERGSVVMGTVKDTARSSPVPSAVRDTVRNNPVPIAMMSMGLAWLLYNRSSRSGRSSETPAASGQAAGEFAGRAQEKAGEVAGQLREKSGQIAGRAQESAMHAKRSASQQAQAAKSQLQETVYSNPIGALLTAFAAGTIIGFIIPESGREREMMGGASQSLMGKAKETAQRTLQKAQHAAESAAHAAGEEFKKEAA